MTSLAQQLRRLALPQSDPALLTRRDVASLLFDPREAAAMDRSTFYALGCTGLEELLGIEPAFLEFQESLFSPASVTLERGVQSRDVNAQLDAAVSLFLARLGPYFLLRPAHKCLEWLLHRFHVHLYNADRLLACALPYHHTNVFVRVLQLLKVGDASNRWNWLQGLQKPGVPLSRAALVSRCCSDLSFMDFICTMVTQSIQAFSGHTETFSQLRVIISFYASSIVPALHAVDPVSDAIIAKLLPYIQKGLRSSLADYRAASYMVVCQLAVKVAMEAGLVDSLAVLVARSLARDPVLVREGLGCLTVLLQSQKEGAVGPRCADRLRSVPALASTLQAMAAAHDLGPLLRYLLPHLVQNLFSSSSDEAGPEASGLLESILTSVPLPGDLDRTVARLVLEAYLGLPEDGSGLDRRLLPVVRVLESRYCGALDDVLAAQAGTATAPQQKRRFHHFLSLCRGGGRHQVLDSDTSLLLGLQHPRAPVRREALDRLEGLVSSGQHALDRSFLKDAVGRRLQDDAPEVVAAALRVLQRLLDGEDVDGEDAASWLLALLLRADAAEPARWRGVLMEAGLLLSHPRLEKADGEQLRRAGWRLLPLLVVTSPDTDLARLLARSPLLTRHTLSLHWAPELDKLAARSSDADFVGVANQRLACVLSEGVANMEASSRRDALEQLVLLARRGGAAVPVLVQTLLRTLDRLSETEQLLTAQGAYAALEPRLLEAVHALGAQEVGGVSVDAPFSGAVAAYLRRCEPAHPEHLQVLLVLLRDLVSALRRPGGPGPAPGPWWNPEDLDSCSCCYLGLLARLLGLLLQGAAQGAATAGFRRLLKLLLQLHLPDPASVLGFLSLLWGDGRNHGDQPGLAVDALLRTRALYVGGALLSAQPAAMLDRLAAADSPVVPSLLCCLTAPVREVRRAALAALRSLADAASPFRPITERLLRMGEELVADPSYLTTVLGELHRGAPAALQPLLRCVQNRSCPSYCGAALLRALGQVTGQPVLAALLPVLERLLDRTGPDTPALLRAETQLLQGILGKYEEDSAPLLAADRTCLDLLVRALRLPGIQLAALAQITKPFFDAVGDDAVRQTLLSVMFDLLDGGGPAVAGAIGAVFKAIAVDAQLVANELAPPEKAGTGATVQQGRRSRLSRRRPPEDGGAVPWRRVTLVLELLQHKKKLRRPQALVPVLFSLLARTMDPCAGLHASVEYTKQLLLSCLLHLLLRLAPDGGAPPADLLDPDRFSVELVVQCIRTSDVPQTHHHALLLLGATASVFPEKVLHHIMPIFTFMGANLLRLDDAYSFRVIDQTVRTVVPALVQARRSSSSFQAAAVATRVMQVFVDALPHVPDHRRLPVLHRLVTTLGPAHSLWVMLLLLLKLQATQGPAPCSEQDQALHADLWVSLCCRFGVAEQLAALADVLRFLLKLPDHRDAPRLLARTKKTTEEVQELVFSVHAHSDQELRRLKFLCLSFTAQLLGSAPFIHQVAEGGDDVGVSLRPLQQRLLEEVLRFIHAVARCVDTGVATPTTDTPATRFWSVLLKRAYDVLEKVMALLPADSFVAVTRGLLGNELPSVRRRAMELLSRQLQRQACWEEEQVASLLRLTADLRGIVGRGQAEEAEPAVNRQTALYSLKLLCRRFGGERREAFVPVLLCAVDVVAAATEDRNVAASALLCIAEAVAALKPLAIAHLPRLMPAVLHALSSREPLSSEVYVLSAVAALQRVAETLPHFLSPYLQDLTSQVCQLSQVEESPSPSSSQLSGRLASLRSTLATKLPPRVLLPTLSRCYSSMAISQDHVGALLSILKEHLLHLEKEVLNVHQLELTSFFLTALDYRAQHGRDDLRKAWEVEGGVIDCLVAMVMKLSELTFRPLFFKLFDWSKPDLRDRTESPESRDRQLTFVRLCDCVAGRLKGLFVMFAGNLVQPFSEVLKHAGALPGASEEQTCLLLQLLLDCLAKVFRYDSRRFLSAERAAALLDPLVDQLENGVGGERRYRRRVAQQLLPCLGQFSAALADDALRRTLNHRVLLKTRHADAQVRLSALQALAELAARLQEDYAALLPETVPFLAERMEDECEEVEQQVQRVVQVMESVLGEPLQSYF